MRCTALRWGVLLLPIWLLGCSEGTVPPPATAAARVSVIKPEIRTLETSVVAAGTLVPRRLVQVHSEVPGLVVTELLAEEGEILDEGQGLATLASERLDAKLAGARAELNRAEQERFRAESLRGNGALAQSEVEAAVVAHAQALARVRALEIDRAHTIVRTPVAGVVLRRRIEVGELVGDQILYELATNGVLEVVAEVSESDWNRVKVGQRAQVTLVDGRVLLGHVHRISGAFDDRTRLGQVWISLAETARGVVSGSGAMVRLYSNREGVLTVPQSCLQHADDGTYAYVVEGGRAVRRELVLGARSSTHVEVLQGLSVDAMVVAFAGSMLRAGDPVQAISVGDSPKGM